MNLCTYCGEIATTMDHVVPWSWNHSNSRKRSGEWAHDQDLTPACLDCNLRLGSVPLFTIKDRAWDLAEKIRKLLKKATKAQWTLDELNELGTRGSLRGHVERSLLERETLQRRLLNLEEHDAEIPA